MSPPFGSWAPLCGSPLPPSSSLDTASPFPECNLFFRELLRVNDPPALTRLFPFNGDIDEQSNIEDLVVIDAVRKAGVGVGVRCDVGRAGVSGQYGDIAQIIASSLSFFFMIYLIWATSRRRAAVGRVEINFLFTLYAVMLPIQVLTLGSVLEQGSTALTVLSAIHVALIAAMFWVLLGNAIVATQVVEDGTPSSIVPLTIVFLIILGLTVYIALDTAFGISSVFLLKNGSGELADLRNVALFVLGLVWPAACVTIYTAIMIYVVYFMLQEVRPLFWFISAFATFAGSQVVLMLAAQPLCKASSGHINSGFIATLLETLSVYLLFLGWKSITEDDWSEPYIHPSEPYSI